MWHVAFIEQYELLCGVWHSLTRGSKDADAENLILVYTSQKKKKKMAAKFQSAATRVKIA